MSTHCRTAFLVPKGVTTTVIPPATELPVTPVNFIITPNPDDPTQATATWEIPT